MLPFLIGLAIGLVAPCAIYVFMVLKVWKGPKQLHFRWWMPLLPVHYKVDNMSEWAALNEFKKDLITWCQNQATGKRMLSRMAHTKREADKNENKADSYDFVALYLQAIEFKTWQH